MANYGDRARIGMLLPSVNRAAEPQITEARTRLELERHVVEQNDSMKKGP